MPSQLKREEIELSSLISVNVGLPRDVEWRGNVVRTAIWKRSVPGRVMARRLNLDGDGQGDLQGHGGEHRAVMVYQLDSYRYWQEHLQRQDFECGQFGENLTVDGLPDDEVCIGDRYRIGGAVFEVTQPRVTCYRVGIRMGNPQMPSLLVSHRRPGFYFRVIEEGEIGAGDEIVKVAEGPERITVAEIDGLLYLPGHSHDRLERALRVPALSAGWKGSLKALVAADSQGGGNAGLAPLSIAAPAWAGFRPLRVKATRRESIDVLSFIFESEDENALPTPLAGQFLTFKLRLDESLPPVLRSYSISGPATEGTYRVSVRRADGPGSNYFHDRVRVGDLVLASAPRGGFVLAPGSNPVVLLSTGIGATPVLSMLHALAANEQNHSPEVWWCYGARCGSEHPFANEVRSLLDRLDHSHLFVAYSQPEAGDQPGRDFHALGRLTFSSLQQLSVPKTADFYLCGPDAFLKDLTAALKDWDVPDSRIHSENFGAGSGFAPGISRGVPTTPHRPSGIPGTGPVVSFARSGIAAPWDDRFQSLLEFAEVCDVPVRWSCRVGVCHTCESGLIEGTVRYTPPPLDLPAEGVALICCSKPSSSVVLDL